jgi:hypothetical protein
MGHRKELEMSGGPLTRNDENAGPPARNRARKQADTYPRPRSFVFIATREKETQ